MSNASQEIQTIAKLRAILHRHIEDAQRLADRNSGGMACHLFAVHDKNLTDDALDELERLRAENERLERQVDYLLETLWLVCDATGTRRDAVSARQIPLYVEGLRQRARESEKHVAALERVRAAAAAMSISHLGDESFVACEVLLNRGPCDCGYSELLTALDGAKGENDDN